MTMENPKPSDKDIKKYLADEAERKEQEVADFKGWLMEMVYRGIESTKDDKQYPSDRYEFFPGTEDDDPSYIGMSPGLKYWKTNPSSEAFRLEITKDD